MVTPHWTEPGSSLPAAAIPPPRGYGESMLLFQFLACAGPGAKDLVITPTTETGDTATGTAGAPDCSQVYDDATLITVESAAMQVYAIDPANAAVTSLSPLDPTLDPTSNLNSSAFRADGTAVVSDAGLRRLVSLDPCTGKIDEIGATGAGALCGVSFGPGGGLYGLDGENNQLVTLDPATGVASPVGDLGFDLGTCGLAYDCVQDRLLGVDGAGSSLFEVDVRSGIATSLVSVDVAFAAVGAEYDPRDATILASTGSQLYRIDVATGTSTLLGVFSGTGNWDDLAYLTSKLPCM